jgi:succinyl-CoA synthetase alpha subunit
MAILVDEQSRVIIQGITGRVGMSFASRMVRHYSNLVGGVTPGRGGEQVLGLPVFNTVAQAVAQTGATASLVVVPAPGVEDAVLEAAEAGIETISVYSEGVPTHTTVRLVAALRSRGARLVGPNAAGVVSPGRASLSELSEDQIPLRPGPIGIASKSGSLAYDACYQIAHYCGLGQSSVVCVGGDTVLGTTLAECVALFASDDQTKLIVLLGEIGGPDELEVASLVPQLGKPLIAYVAGHFAPPGKRIGHAGALVGAEADTAAAKSAALESAGARVARLVTDLPALIKGYAPTPLADPGG